MAHGAASAKCEQNCKTGGAPGDGKRCPRACACPSVFDFSLHRFTRLPQWVVHQRIRGEDLGVRPFTFPSPSLSRFSPTGYGKVPLFPTLPPYFSRHSPCLANCKISRRVGEGIFLKAFTPYALIYCALRPTGEEVKEKNENHLTRAREGNPKNTPSSPCRLSPRPNIRLPHVAATFFFLSYSFPLLRHVAQSRCGEERKCMYAHFNAAQRGTRPRVFDTKHNK